MESRSDRRPIICISSYCSVYVTRYWRETISFCRVFCMQHLENLLTFFHEIEFSCEYYCIRPISDLIMYADDTSVLISEPNYKELKMP